jgi:molybdate transport system substrate-binding protein
MSSHPPLRASALVLALLLTAMHPAPARSDPAANPPAITVFGAASLTNVLQDLADGFTRETSVPVHFSFAASSALARQIESGAPADLFVSADVDWMDYLSERHLIQEASRRELAGNRLVLIAPTDDPLVLHLAPHAALRAALGNGRLAIADPESVPAGRYARQALEHLGLWNDIAGRYIGAESVRAVLAYVDRGEAPLGIVYRTDALIDHKVRTVDVFPEDSHPRIVYLAALTRTAKPSAQRFMRYLDSAAARVAFKSYGFTSPTSEHSNGDVPDRQTDRPPPTPRP